QEMGPGLRGYVSLPPGRGARRAPWFCLHVWGKYGIVSNGATAKRPRTWSLVVPRTASAVRRGHQRGALLYPVVPRERRADNHMDVSSAPSLPAASGGT